MKKTKRSLKIKALFLTLAFLPSLFPVNYLFASNNGPNAPEAASFEPVDATDMVNLVTGDMSYVLPLLNVPSPEGGYPLALSYHAGIAMDQEASWVGLGWSLNPGAINREVSGIPDDWKNGTKADVVYDIGGETILSDFSFSVGIGDASVGMFASQASHRSFGGDNSYTSSTNAGFRASYAGFGINIGTNNVGVSASYAGINADVGTNGAGLSFDGLGGLGVRFDRNGTSATYSNYGVGISLGSESSSFSLFGISSIDLFGQNSLSASRSLSVQKFRVIIPAYYFTLNFGSKKTRYWTYDRLTYDGVGSLHASNLLYDDPNYPLGMTLNFDSYESIYKYNKSEQNKENNFSYVSYDSYNVSGQGISGKMEPKIFDLGYIRNKFQNLEYNADGTTRLRSEPLENIKTFEKSISNNSIHFYFNNANASYLNLTSDNWDLTDTFPEYDDINKYYPTSTLQTTSPNGNSNYNATKNRLATGNYVESYTNREIISGYPQNYIETTSKGFNRSSLITDKAYDGIGAFAVTTLDGKTYHYSLPVYQKEKFSRSAAIENNIDHQFFEEQNLDSYATHWLLTAVTGPDYIDINNNHQVDNADYGYWVNFEYGKWSDGFSWRTPAGKEDFQLSETGQSYSWGIKEVYYLNKINTRTHSAFFVKEDRVDNKSTSIGLGISRTNPKVYRTDIGGDKGFICRGGEGDCFLIGSYQNLPIDGSFKAAMGEGEVVNKCYINTREHKSLKLKKILLFDNDDIPQNLVNSYSQGSTGSLKSELFISQDIEWNGNNQPTLIVKDKNYFGEFYNNVLDIGDINDLTEIENGTLKVVDFTHDNSLFNGVANSVHGRLTLNRVLSKGKNGIAMLPPYSFKYHGASYNRSIDPWGYSPGFPQAGSLNRIITPVGSDIQITYEQDDYHREAIPTRRVFDEKLQFTFSRTSDKLQILVENENLSGFNLKFDQFFEPGIVNMDLWACYKHDYFSGGCKTRGAEIDIPESESLTVVSVNHNSLLLEGPLSLVESSVEGNDLFYGFDNFAEDSPVGIEYHPNIIQVDKYRNECAEAEGGCINTTPRLVLTYNLFGNKDLRDVDGGGLRVKQVSITNGTENYATNYYYNNPGYDSEKYTSNYQSSGVTSYAPSRYAKEVMHINELPSPYVMYEHVTVEKTGNGLPKGASKYQFKVLGEPTLNSDGFTLGDALKINKLQQDSYPVDYWWFETSYENVHKYKYELEDNLSSLGSLLKVEQLNTLNQVINKVEYEYMPNEELQQGIIRETFLSLKDVRIELANATSAKHNLHYTSSSKVSYPNVLKSTTVTEMGHSATTYNDVYDFNTGSLLETRTFDSEKNALKSVAIPAYTKYSGMGSKVDNISNKNMLSQAAANYALADVGGEWKEIGVGINTWNNNWTYVGDNGSENTPSNNSEKIWRKHKTYTWNGEVNPDGTLKNYTDFNWALPSQADPWLLTSETSHYNHYSMPVENIDVNQNKSTVKMGEQKAKIFATGNAGINEIFYSGAEDLIANAIPKTWSGGVYNANGEIVENPNLAHTGKKSIKMVSGSNGFYATVKKGKSDRYKASVWVRKEDQSYTRLLASGVIVFPKTAETIVAGDWAQLNFYFQVDGNSAIVTLVADGKTVYSDDFRIHPVYATMNSYVYNEWDQLTHILGPNNMATRYEYDAAGRLIRQYSELANDEGLVGGFKPASEYRYNYKRIGELDTNGNGMVDSDEGLSPLSARPVPEIDWSTPGVLTIFAQGGSGDYRYRFAQGLVTSALEIEQLTYGSETTNPQMYVQDIPCSRDADNPYMSYVVKTIVRDVTTNETTLAIAFYSKYCDPNDGGGNPPQE